MTAFTIIAAPEGTDPAIPLLAPILEGLAPEVADCAICLPIGDANRLLLAALQRFAQEFPGAGAPHAGALCVDPFRPAGLLLDSLAEAGAAGIVNLPCAAVIDGRFRDAMAAVPATLDHELAVLGRAGTHGLEARAVVLSREQGLRAMDAGVHRLILHPGLPVNLDRHSRPRLADALLETLDALRRRNEKAELLVYRHPSFADVTDAAVEIADGTLDYAVRFDAGAPP